MARKKKPAANQAVAIETRHLVHIWQSRGGKPCFLSDAPQAGAGYRRIAVVDVGRPFSHHVPSVIGSVSSGLVFDGMTGENAKPWTPSQVIAAARFGLFGFKLEEAP